MLHPIRIALLASCLAGTLAAAPQGIAWTPDLVHSRAEFLVSHLIVSKVWGHIAIKSIDLTTGPDGVPVAVDATLVPAYLDTDNHERDEDLRANYFEVTRYPTIAFKSTSVEPLGGGNFSCTGELTIHGVTKRAVLTGHVEGRIPETGGGERIGLTATTKIDRRDFGIDNAQMSPAGVPVVGDDVAITLTVEATRSAASLRSSN